MQLYCRVGKLPDIFSCHRLRNTTSGNSICAGIVGIEKTNPVHGCRNFKSSFTAPIAIYRSIDDERVNDGSRVAKRLDAVTNRFVAQQRDVVRCIEHNHRDTSRKYVSHRGDYLRNHLGSEPSVLTGHLRRDPMHAAGLGRDVDPRISEPVPAFDGLTPLVNDTHVRGNNAAGCDINSRGLEIEDTKSAVPKLTFSILRHDTRLLPAGVIEFWPRRIA